MASGRSFKQCSPGVGLVEGAGSLSSEKTVQKCFFYHQPLEEQVVGQPTTPQTETAVPQNLLSDKDNMGRRDAGTNSEARKASASQAIPADIEESLASGPSPYHEDGASGAEKTDARTSLLPVVESPSTTQEDVIFLVAVGAQGFMDPSCSQAEEEGASCLDSPSVQLKVESV